MVTPAPGLKINELSFSAFATQLGLARFVVVGGATKGPVGVATPTTSIPDLDRIFGDPLTNDYGLQTMRQFLKKGNNGLYLRVTDGTDTVAAVDVPGQSGGTAAVAATGTVSFTGSVNPADGETVTIRDGTDAIAASGTITLTGATQPTSGDTLTIFDNQGTTVIFGFGVGGDVTVAIGGSAAATLTNLIAAINTSALNVTAVDTTTGDPEATVTHNQPGVVGNAATMVPAGTTPPTVTSPLTGGSDGTAVIFEFDDDATVGGGNIGVLIGATAAATLINLITAINGSTLDIQAVDGTVTIPLVDLTNSTPGDAGNQTILETGASIGVTGMSGGLDVVAGAVVTLMSIEATSSGTWGNGTSVVITKSAIFGAPADNIDIVVSAVVDQSGAVGEVENFTNLSLDATDVRFIETVLKDGILGEVAASEFISADVLVDGTPTPDTYKLGDTTAGTDGLPGVFSDYIGTVSGQTATGLKALRNPDNLEFNLLSVPQITPHFAVIDEIFALAVLRGDFYAPIDPPFGLDEAGVISWHNGTNVVVPNAPTTVLDNSFAGMAGHAWVQVADDVNKVDIFLPPAGFFAANAAVNDDFVGPWFPVGGHNRGVLEALKVEYSPDRESQKNLVAGQNRVNPIVDFANQGPTFFGNRTLLRADSPLNSLHVRRMVLHAKKLVANAIRFLIFEPNDPVTWRKFELLVNPILEFIGANQGLEDFRVVVNASTNPPALRAQKKMKGRIIVVALESAEAIEIDFAISAAGTELVELTGSGIA